MVLTSKLMAALSSTWGTLVIAALVIAMIYQSTWWLWAALWIFSSAAVVALVWTLVYLWVQAWREQRQIKTRGY